MAEKKGDYVAVPTTETSFHPPPPIPTQVIVQPCPKCVHKECRLKKGIVIVCVTPISKKL